MSPNQAGYGFQSLRFYIHNKISHLNSATYKKIDLFHCRINIHINKYFFVIKDNLCFHLVINVSSKETGNL